MSASEHTVRSRRWLEEQLEMLGNLRNAQPRDPSFKLWRQNTLTVLQRIWPGEQARSERFRRIAFSPASPRADFREMREWYVRGCAEAVDLLRAMLTEVDAIGVPEPGGPVSPPPLPASSREDDFPVLELPSADAPAIEPEGGTDFVLLDAEGTAAALAPKEGEPCDKGSDVPAPATLRVEPRAAAAASSEPESAPPKLPPRTRHSRPAPVPSAESLPTLPGTPAPSAPKADTSPVATPPSASPAPLVPRVSATPPPVGDRRTNPPDRRAPRPAKPRRVAPQPRLKDLLGLQDFGNYGASAVPAQPAPEETPATPAPDVTPAPPAPELTPATPASAVTPAPSASAVTPAPSAPAVTPATPASAVTPAPSASAVTPAPPAPAAPRAGIGATPPASRPRVKDTRAIDEVMFSGDSESPAAPAHAAVPPPVPPVPPAALAPATPAPAPPPAQPAAPAVSEAQASEAPAPAEPTAAAATEGVDVARATADFMRNSPVLGLQGRPVQRASDTTQFLEPDAIAIASLASEIGRHVIDEGAREPLRVALLELAAQVEAKAPEWPSLRELVSSAMAHPELARRLVPILLPWLGRAA